MPTAMGALSKEENAPPITGASVGVATAAGALVALLGYLVQSPLPVKKE